MRGISASVLLEPPSIKILFTVSQRLPEYRQLSIWQGIIQPHPLPRWANCVLCFCPLETFWVTLVALSWGKELDLKDAMMCRKVSSCSAEGMQKKCVARLEGSSFGVFPADISRLAKPVASTLNSGFDSRLLLSG